MVRGTWLSKSTGPPNFGLPPPLLAFLRLTIGPDVNGETETEIAVFKAVQSIFRSIMEQIGADDLRRLISESILLVRVAFLILLSAGMAPAGTCCWPWISLTFRGRSSPRCWLLRLSLSSRLDRRLSRPRPFFNFIYANPTSLTSVAPRTF